MLGIENILLHRDIIKIKGYINNINNILSSNYITTEDLYDNIDELINNEEVYQIIKENIFAGKTTVKFWKIYDTEKDNLNKIKQRIESCSFYNKNLLEKVSTNKIESPTPYTSIVLEEGKYLIRLLVPSYDKSTDNGVEILSLHQNINIVCIIDLNNKYLEVRGNYKLSKKVAEKLGDIFDISLIELPVLLKYDNKIDKFKESFSNAKFTNVKSIPYKESPLTDKEINILIDTLKALDEFYRTKDYIMLETILKNLDINTNEVGFTHLLLTGLSKIGISSKIDNKNDITNQPMYKLLESYLLHQSGHLRITSEDGSEYSIQIGLKTNNVTFNNNNTNEKFISVIRERLLYNNINDLEGVSRNMIEEFELEETLRDMVKSGIHSFYAEYMAELKKIDVQEAFESLYQFSVNTNKLRLIYEIRCEECSEEINKPIEKLENINLGERKLCVDCGNIVDISLENVYVRFNISEAWIKYINKKSNLRLDTENDIYTEISKKCNKANFSLGDYKHSNTVNINIISKLSLNDFSDNSSNNTNYGVTRSMGNGNKIMPAF